MYNTSLSLYKAKRFLSVSYNGQKVHIFTFLKFQLQEFVRVYPKVHPVGTFLVGFGVADIYVHCTVQVWWPR